MTQYLLEAISFKKFPFFSKATTHRYLVMLQRGTMLIRWRLISVTHRQRTCRLLKRVQFLSDTSLPKPPSAIIFVERQNTTASEKRATQLLHEGTTRSLVMIQFVIPLKLI